jgi:hypothetical protein
MANTHYLTRKGVFEKAVSRGGFHVKSRDLQDAVGAIRDYQKSPSAEKIQRVSHLLRKWRVTHTREFKERGQKLEADLRSELKQEFAKYPGLTYEEPTSNPGVFASELWRRRYIPLRSRRPQIVECRTFERANDAARALAEPVRIAPASRARSSTQSLPGSLRQAAAEAIRRSPERAWVLQLQAKGGDRLSFDARSKSFAAAQLLSRSEGRRGELVIQGFRRNIDYTLELVGFPSAARMNRGLRRSAQVGQFCPTPLLAGKGLQRTTRPEQWFRKSGYQELPKAVLNKLRDDPVARDWVFPSDWKKFRRAAGPPVPMAPGVPFAGLALFLLYFPIAVASTDWKAPRDHVATKFTARIRLWEVLPD